MAGFEKTQIDVAKRANYALAFCGFCFALILLRLWYLQVLQSDFFREQSETNRIRVVFITPPRGLILDRNGHTLVNNRPSFNIEFVREDSPHPEETLRSLARILATDADILMKRMRVSEQKRRRFEPKLILKDVSRDVVAKVAARRYALPGVVINVIPARDYVHGEYAAHALGYLREVSAHQLEQPEFANYHRGDLVGQTGVEKLKEPFLHGVSGVKEVVVNAAGHRIREYKKGEERPGHNVVVTLDREVQQAAEEALAGKAGAVVALDPRSGEVLAMSSKPGFDPNLFIGELSTAVWHNLVYGEKRLTNRAIQGIFAPGSVFKFIMGTAALAEGVVTPREDLSCGGRFYLGNNAWQCWKKEGHGVVNLRKALRESCNVYFYNMGQRLGIERIADYAQRFGFGSLTGVDLPDEQRGVMPSPEWKRERFKTRPAGEQKWYPGETPSVSIGQGAVAVTPLQIARAMSALVNGGKLLRPLVVKRVYLRGGEYDHLQGSEIENDLGVDPAVLDEVRKGLVAVVNEAGGTGGRARLDERLKVIIGGKTGTAQRKSSKLAEKGGRLQDNGWFAGFAPAEEPEIVVVALVVGGGHGGTAAAPVVKRVMEAYFSKKLGISLTDRGAKPGAADQEVLSDAD